MFEQATQHVIIGVPFLSKHNAENTLTSPSVTAHSPGHITIPPNSEILCVAHISHPIPESTVGECVSFQTINRKGLLTANAAVIPHDNKIPVRIYNSTGVPQHINANERNVTFSPWTNELCRNI